MGKELLPGMDIERAKILRAEIGKVRCWLTGFRAGRNLAVSSIAGEDSLRQIQCILDDAIKKVGKK